MTVKVTKLPPEATTECVGHIGPVRVSCWGDGVWQAQAAGYVGGFRKNLRAALGSLLDVLGAGEALGDWAQPSPTDEDSLGGDGFGVLVAEKILEMDESCREIIAAIRGNRVVKMRPKWGGYREPWSEGNELAA